MLDRIQGKNRHRSHHRRRAGKPGKTGRCTVCYYSLCRCPGGVKTVKTFAIYTVPGITQTTEITEPEPRQFKWSGFANLKERE